MHSAHFTTRQDTSTHQLTFLYALANLIQAIQYDADLQCHVEAFPSPSIVWLKDGYQLNDNQNYRISEFTTTNEFTDSVLRVIRIEKRQYGRYSCKAINKLGSHSQETELYEVSFPVCPPACDIGIGAGSIVTAVKFFSTSAALLAIAFNMA